MEFHGYTDILIYHIHFVPFTDSIHGTGISTNTWMVDFDATLAGNRGR